MEIVRVEKLAIAENKLYSGQGFYRGNEFTPHGYGWLSIKESRVYGFFQNGILNGPSYHPMDYMMYAMQMKNNRGNGWGMMINSGILSFGRYSDSKEDLDLTDAVQWYYDIMISLGKKESMFHGYYNAGEIMIGWKGDENNDFMGFHYLNDGSVYVGSSKSLKKTGYFIKFCADGSILIGEFENGMLIQPMDIQELISYYYDDRSLLIAAMMNGGDFDPEKKHDYQDVVLDTSIDYFSVKQNEISLKKAIEQDPDTRRLAYTMEMSEPILERRIRSYGLPIDEDEVLIKNVPLNDDGTTFWGQVDHNDKPLGYGLVENDERGSFGLYLAAANENFEEEGMYLFNHCQKVQSANFYGSNVYIGDITSKASWYGSSHYSTSRYGLAILKNGMYVGEFPAGFKMKRVIGKFFDLNGNVYSGMFTLPIDQDPDWIDDDGGSFPF